MVLVSNQWQNKSKDEKSTASGTTATAISTNAANEASTTKAEIDVNRVFTAEESTKTTTTATTSTSATSNEDRIKESTPIEASTIPLQYDSMIHSKASPSLTEVVTVTPTVSATARNDLNVDDSNSSFITSDHHNQQQEETLKHDLKEKRKNFYENITEKEKAKKQNDKADVIDTITKVTNTDNEQQSLLSSNKHQRCLSPDTDYEKLTMESLKESYADDGFVDKILDDVDNAMNLFNDTHEEVDSNASTMNTLAPETTARSKISNHNDTARNSLVSSITWNNEANAFICDVKRLNVNRKALNRKNFLIYDNHIAKKDDSNNTTDVTALPTSNIADNSSVVTTNINKSDATTIENNGQAKIVLLCEPNSHPFQTRIIYLTPNIECMVGRLIATSKAAENNAIFDCKVLSRKHAVIWYTPDGKFWVRDTKSSNGTFINDIKLDNAEAELHFDDIVKFGVDVLENSRKEVHGCIIACVKLYLPTISIDSQAYRNQCLGGDGGRITYDELNRLNLYIQETASREKSLTTKLCTIQNTLDATRKNSALCWQAMISEDQLLHRIHSLEKKLQFMEKNVPENVLRNEVLKLIDDKAAYQLKTKEALRKMYQERNDAIQMFTKMENAYAESDSECCLLREQIASSTQIVQDVNSRLMQLENEYSSYKEENMKQQQETKEHSEKLILELTEKLRESEEECIELKRQLSVRELQQQEQQQQEQQQRLLENQAIEKIDAAIADVIVDDDGDYIDIDDNKSNNPNSMDDLSRRSVEHNKLGVSKNNVTFVRDKKIKSIGEEEKSEPKRVNESIIMKWLKNSDINKTESSLNIFKAICNENEHIDGDDSNSDDSSTEEKYVEALEAYKKISPSVISKDMIKTDLNADDVRMEQKCTNFINKLKMVQKYLKQLDAEIENETNLYKIVEDENEVNNDNNSVITIDTNTTNTTSTIINDNDDQSDGELNKNQQNDQDVNVLPKKSKNHLLLKCGVNMLHEAYNEIKNIYKIYNSISGGLSELKEHEEKGSSLPERSCELEEKILKTEIAILSSPHPPNSLYGNNEHINFKADMIDFSISDGHQRAAKSKSETEIAAEASSDKSFNLLQQKLHKYQIQVDSLTEKMKRTELDAEHTLEIMQYECEESKQKIDHLTKKIQQLQEEKEALEKVINENNVNRAKTAAENNVDNNEKQSIITSSSSTSSYNVRQHYPNYTDVYYELNDPLNDISSSNNSPRSQLSNELEFEREEELITYKERLENQEQRNIELRQEIEKLKLNQNQSVNCYVARAIIPCGAVALALIIYFLNTYTY